MSKIKGLFKLSLSKMGYLKQGLMSLIEMSEATQAHEHSKDSFSDEIPHFEQVICWGDNTSAIF